MPLAVRKEERLGKKKEGKERNAEVSVASHNPVYFLLR